MGNSSSATLGGATEDKVAHTTPEIPTMAATMAATVTNTNPNYWRQSHNKVLPDNLPGVHKAAFLKNGPRFTREYCEPRMRGRLWSPCGSPMSSACASRMDKENYGAFFDVNSADSTLYKVSSRFHSRIPSVTASRMVSAMNSPMQSCMTSRATSRRSSFSRGNYIRRTKRHAPLPPATGQASRALTPESFSSSNDHVRRKFRRKRQAPGPPLQRTWSEKSIDVPAQIAEIRAEVHNGPPPEPAADYDDDDDEGEENMSVKMESLPPEETQAASEESSQPEEHMPLEPLSEPRATSPHNEDTEDPDVQEVTASDLEKTDEHLRESFHSASEVPSMSTEQCPSEPEVPDEPKSPPPPPPPPLPVMGAPMVIPKRIEVGSEVVKQEVVEEEKPSLKRESLKLSSQEIFAAELLKAFKDRESRMTRGTLRMKRTSKSLVYTASITKKESLTKKLVVAHGDTTKPVIANEESIAESPHSVDSVAWVPADDLPDDAFDDDEATPEPNKHYQKKSSPVNGHLYRKNDSSTKPAKKSSKYNSLSKLKNSMRTAFGSIGKGITNRKKIDEVFDIGVDNDSGEKWEIYPAGDYDDVPDGPIKVDHVEKCAAYAYQTSTGELVLLPNYDRILVTADGRRIREADITKVNKPKWLKRLPDETEKKPIVETSDPPKVVAEKEREQQTKLEKQFAEVRFLNTKFQGSGKNGVPRTLSHDELLRLVAAKIPPPSPDCEPETSNRWSLEESNSGMLDQYFVDMSTYSLDRNNNKKNSKSKMGKKTNTWGSKSKRPSLVKSELVSVEKTANTNPVYSSGGEEEDEERKAPPTFTWRANSQESSSTKDSGYKTERDGSDKTDQSLTTPDVSPASTLEARPVSSMPDTLNTQVSSQPQLPAVTPQQPVFAQPPQWYSAWPNGMGVTAPLPYAANTNMFNPMAATYNPAMYNPYMQPMVSGYMNPGMYATMPAAQTLPALSTAAMTTPNMAVSMSDSLGQNISLASTLPLLSKSNNVTTPPALLPKPRKELILGPVGFRPVKFNPDIKVTSVTIPPTVASSDSRVDTENVTTSNGVG